MSAMQTCEKLSWVYMFHVHDKWRDRDSRSLVSTSCETAAYRSTSCHGEKVSKQGTEILPFCNIEFLNKFV